MKVGLINDSLDISAVILIDCSSFSVQNFLRDLLTEAQRDKEVTEDKLIEYTDTMVS